MMSDCSTGPQSVGPVEEVALDFFFNKHPVGSWLFWMDVAVNGVPTFEYHRILSYQ